MSLTRAGPGGVKPPPTLRFFADSEKTAARSAAIFGTPYPTSFPHILQKFQTQVMSGQVTRPGQVTSPLKNCHAVLLLHQLTDRYETFRNG